MCVPRLGCWLIWLLTLPKITFTGWKSRRLSLTTTGQAMFFASVLCGSLLAGMDMQSALEKSAFFVYLAAKDTAAAGAPVRDGVMFENI